MNWIAPSEKDAANDTLEKRRWGAASSSPSSSFILPPSSFPAPRLCRMNLAVHGLEGDIRQAITTKPSPTNRVEREAGTQIRDAGFAANLHQSTGRFDCCKQQQRLVELGFVLANLPFNMSEWGGDRLRSFVLQV